MSKKKKKKIVPLLSEKVMTAQDNAHKLYFMQRSISNITKHLHKQNRKGFKK